MSLLVFLDRLFSVLEFIFNLDRLRPLCCQLFELSLILSLQRLQPSLVVAGGQFELFYLHRLHLCERITVTF